MLWSVLQYTTSQCVTYPDGFNQYIIQKCPFNSTNNVPIVLTNPILLDPTTADDGQLRKPNIHIKSIQRIDDSIKQSII